jgi:Protein of unknown function (DUF3592)
MPKLVSEIFLIVGVILGGFLFWQVLKGLKAKNWPTVSGKVADSKVTMHYDDEGDRMYGSFVSYLYNVDGLAYNGDKRSFGDYSSNNRQRAEKIVARYMPGTDVKVYYRPDDPEDSVLEPGTNMVMVLFLLLPAVFLVVGVLGLLGVLG